MNPWKHCQKSSANWTLSSNWTASLQENLLNFLGVADFSIKKFGRFKGNPYLCTRKTAISLGEMLEWLKRHAWKACDRQNWFASSNLALSAERYRLAAYRNTGMSCTASSLGIPQGLTAARVLGRSGAMQTAFPPASLAQLARARDL